MDYLFIEKCAEDLKKLLIKKRFKSAGFDSSRFLLSVGDLNVEFHLSNPNAVFISDHSCSSEAFRRLRGAFLKEISLLNKDRVMEFEFIKVSPSGKREVLYIIVELTGKDANVVFVNAERRIVEVLREFEGSYRSIKRGVIYKPPPMEKKEFEEINFGEVSSEGIKNKLFKFVKGLSPLNSKEISLMFTKIGDFKTAYYTFMKRHTASSEAYLYFDNQGCPLALTTFDYESLKNFDREVFRGDAPFLDCWKKFAELKQQREFLLQKEKLSKKLKNILVRIESEIKDFEDVKSILEKANHEKRKGELLKYNAHRIFKVESPLKVKDYETGKTVEVEIDTSIPLKVNIEKFFKAYKRLKRKAELSEYNLSRIKKKLEFMNFLLEKVKEANSYKELKQIQDVIEGNRKEDRKKDKKTFRKYVLSSGREIIVGRNGFENEFISTKLANPWDLWFHAKDIPGSHVVLRLQKHEEPEGKDILEAASAAAFFSAGRDSGKVQVDYTYVKYLKKPKGTPVGFVTYKNEKSITVNPLLFGRLTES